MNKLETHERMYRYVGIEWAIELLRPGATWEVTNSTFTKWDDPRPCPSWDEINDTIKKIKKFEQSIDTIFLPSQIEKFERELDEVHESL